MAIDEEYIQAVQEQVRAALLFGWEVVIKPPCDEEPDDVEPEEFCQSTD